MPKLSAGEIALLTGGEIRGDSERVVEGVAPLESAGPRELSFVANPRYLSYLQGARAGVVLISAKIAEAAHEGADAARTLVVVADPHLALWRILPRLFPAAAAVPGVHPTAVVAEDAVLGDGVSVGAYAVIGARSRIGDGCEIGAHVVVGEDCAVGAATVLHPHVTLYPDVVIGERCVVQSGARLGRPGFGFVWAEGGHRRIPQVGGCRLEDDVEIGANVNIDRGSIADTVIGAGTKVDALVHIGHNVSIGKHVLLLAQVGMAGSSSVGDGAVLAGQVGVAGHLAIGAGARIAAQSGVIGDVEGGATVSGMPARLHRDQMRAQAALQKLPELTRRVRELEKELRALTGPDQS